MNKQANERDLEAAIEIAVRFSGIDGMHHKNWVVDQMVRALCGCSLSEKEDYIENEKYLDIVRRAKNGSDGPDTFDWDIGIAP